MEYGYARVSSKEQNLARQIKELVGAGVEERYIYTDKQSGKDFDRKSYNLLVQQIQPHYLEKVTYLLYIALTD